MILVFHLVVGDHGGHGASSASWAQRQGRIRNTRSYALVPHACKGGADDGCVPQIAARASIRAGRPSRSCSGWPATREALRVTIGGGKQNIAGAILVWGVLTPEGRTAAMNRYGLADVLSVEDMLRDLAEWQPQEGAPAGSRRGNQGRGPQGSATLLPSSSRARDRGRSRPAGKGSHTVRVSAARGSRTCETHHRVPLARAALYLEGAAGSWTRTLGAIKSLTT